MQQEDEMLKKAGKVFTPLMFDHVLDATELDNVLDILPEELREGFNETVL